MRIIKIDIPKTENENDGLDHIKMDKLGKIVLLAGKNGSGKTRILNKIFNTFRSKPGKTLKVQSLIDIKQHRNNINYYQSQLKTHETNFLQQSLNQDQRGEILRNIENTKRAIDDINKNINNCLTIQSWNLIETDLMSDIYSGDYYVPKNLTLQNPSNSSMNEIKSSASSIDQVGVEHLPQGTFAKIQFLQNRWSEATHQNSQIPKDEKEKAKNDYEKLQGIVKIFLNTNIARTIDGEATIFGFPLGQSKLSDGQKVLLQFCLAIYSQEIALKDMILILDEPENHLHPSVIIETIEKIQNCVTNGQIWIATHSIPLLAHFDPSLLWFVEQGKITYAGKIPEKVLNSLLGEDCEIEKLQDFISLPAQYATNKYAFDCLFEPNAVMTDSTDLQSDQIRNDLLSISGNGKVRILDYGAGKGRLISNLLDLDLSSQEKILTSIEYIAFDKYTKDKDYCESSLTKVFGNADKKYYNDFPSLFSCFDKHSFDIVIMCNVLHEIDPKDWLKLFKEDGDISRCLKENGKLLLVEDHQLPVGEKAYQKGFLVLDTEQIRDLFYIKEHEIDFKYIDFKENGRLKSHYIPRKYLIRIDASSREKAINSLSNTAKEKILKIREEEKNYQNGKLHGFWTQQFANAQLNLAEFTTK